MRILPQLMKERLLAGRRYAVELFVDPVFAFVWVLIVEECGASGRFRNYANFFWRAVSVSLRIEKRNRSKCSSFILLFFLRKNELMT